MRIDNIKVDDPLWPFKNEKGECWTSTEARDWTKTGFAVPGEQDLGKKGKALVEQYLRDTYYWYVQLRTIVVHSINISSRATEGIEPPPTLKWPKDLAHVEALTGKSETPVQAPSLRCEPSPFSRALPSL